MNIKIVIPTNFITLSQLKLDASTKNIIYSLDGIGNDNKIDLVYVNLNPFYKFENLKLHWNGMSNKKITLSNAEYNSKIEYIKNTNSSLSFDTFDFFNSVTSISSTELPSLGYYDWISISYVLYNNILESTETDIWIFSSSNYFMWNRGCLTKSIKRYSKYSDLPLYFPQNIWSFDDNVIKKDSDISQLTDESILKIRTLGLRQFLCRPKEIKKFTQHDIFNHLFVRNNSDLSKYDGTWDSGISFEKSDDLINYNPIKPYKVNLIRPNLEYKFKENTESLLKDSIKIKDLKKGAPFNFVFATDVPIFHLFESFMITKGWELYNVPQVDFKSIKLPLSSVDNDEDVDWDFGTKFEGVHEFFIYLNKLFNSEYYNNIEKNIFEELNKIYDSITKEDVNIRNYLEKEIYPSDKEIVNNFEKIISK